MTIQSAKSGCLFKSMAAGWLLAVMAALPEPTQADGSLGEALLRGKFDLYMRYRYEYVDDGAQGSGGATGPARLKDAHASTARLALGYTTGLFHGLGAYAQAEDVLAIGRESYNDGGANGRTRYAAVVDPSDFEFNQAYLRFEGLPKTALRLGRQEITHRDAPLHRYIGNILWRQNWQSFDALRITTEYFANTRADYAYIWNVNRIFGQKNALPDRADFHIDGHLIRIEYSGLPQGKLEPYAYLLDFGTTTSERFSTQTYGLRFQGAHDLQPKVWKLLYTGEIAHQSDYADNPNDIGALYGLGEAGVTWTLGKLVESVTLKGSYEFLEGSGGLDAFQTPLGTNHAFQGWADRFLVTPGDGIEDKFVTFLAKVKGAQIVVMFHDLNSDHDDYDYGTELDMQLTKTLKDRYTLGIKYSDYEADGNALNLARNGRASPGATGKQAFDLEKVWAWVEIKY